MSRPGLPHGTMRNLPPSSVSTRVFDAVDFEGANFQRHQNQRLTSVVWKVLLSPIGGKE